MCGNLNNRYITLETFNLILLTDFVAVVPIIMDATVTTKASYVVSFVI